MTHHAHEQQIFLFPLCYELNFQKIQFSLDIELEIFFISIKLLWSRNHR
jgi:hypothetical protein